MQRPDGAPVHEATLYLLRLRTRALASNSIHTVCGTLAIVYNELKDVDLLERFKAARFLTAAELGRLETAAQFWANDLPSEKPTSSKAKVISLHRVHPKARSIAPEQDQVVLQTRATRLRHIAQFLEFLAGYVEGSLPRAQGQELAAQAKQGLAAFRGGIPRVSNRAKVGARTGLADEQVDLLLAVVNPESKANPWRRGFVRKRNWVIVVLLLATGMRRGELLGLQIRDIAQHTAQLEILRRADDPDDPRAEEPNTKTGERRVELSPSIMRVFWRYINEDRHAIKAARKHQYIFVADDGAPLSLSSIDKLFQELRRECPGLPRNLTSHVMRHTWNDRFSEQADAMGLSPELEQKARNEQQGWTDDSKTAATYTRRHASRKGREISLKLQEKLDDAVEQDK